MTQLYAFSAAAPNDTVSDDSGVGRSRPCFRRVAAPQVSQGRHEWPNAISHTARALSSAPECRELGTQ